MIACVLVALSAARTQAQITISVAPNNTVIAGGANALGQTLTVPVDPVVSSFSIQLSSSPFLPPNQPSTFNMYPWDPSTFAIDGPSLFSSGPTVGVPYTPNVNLLSFATGDLALIPGKQYLALLTDNIAFGSNYTAPIALYLNGFGPYSGGEAVSGPFGSAFLSPLFQNPAIGTYADLAFVAKFDSGATSVPEPSPGALTAGLLGLSLAMFGARAALCRRLGDDRANRVETQTNA